MIHRVKGQIRVAAIFGPGNKIRPVWFDRQGRKHTVTEVTYTWQERQGDATIFHFAVTDGADLYELFYNTASQIWALTAVDGEG